MYIYFYLGELQVFKDSSIKVIGLKFKVDPRDCRNVDNILRKEIRKYI